jgi:hypothetical protein
MGCRTVIFISLLSIPGCFPRPDPVVGDPDPSVKIPAIKRAVAGEDRKVVSQLVEDLDSDDPAIRLFAIRALQKLTGQTFDYRYYEGEMGRRDAVNRWRAWLASSGSPSTSPTTGPAPATTPVGSRHGEPTTQE